MLNSSGIKAPIGQKQCSIIWPTFVSEKYFRPAEVEELLGDSSKARKELGWEPKYSFDDLVKEMVEEDCN